LPTRSRHTPVESSFAQSPEQAGSERHIPNVPFVAADGSGALAITAGTSAAALSLEQLLQLLEEVDKERALHVAVVESLGCAVFLQPPDGSLRPLNEAARRLAIEHGVTLSRETLAAGSPLPLVEVAVVGHPGHHALVLAARHMGLQRQLDLATRLWELTPRQVLVLTHVADGLSNKEIAAKLECAEATVEQHLTTIYRKAGAQGRPLILALLWKLTA
jgi:DNA-binding CsgD family transcriptional regulator